MYWRGVIGVLGILFVTWLLSERRRDVKIWKIICGLLLQLSLAVCFLKIPGLKNWISVANEAVDAVEKATTQATAFMFGYLGGAPLPFQETTPGASYIVAFRVLPLVLVMSAISSVLFYWGVLPLIVKGFAHLLKRTFRMSGAAGMAAAADVFLGIAEAPLFVRPYLPKMNRSELFMVMTCGMGSVAGTVLVLYASVLSPVVPDAIGHILVGSVITIPAAIIIAHIMLPEMPGQLGDDEAIPQTADSAIDALIRGTMDGVQMLFSIIAMILVLFTLVNLCNHVIGWFPKPGGQTLTLQGGLGIIFYPFTWLMGLPAKDLSVASNLMGTKVVLNEFVAYLEMAHLPDSALDPRSRIILTYAMCGFANFASLGILIGGLTTMVPERKKEIVSLGFRSLISGNLTTLLTGALVGLLF